jgi:hypothetical protein
MTAADYDEWYDEDGILKPGQFEYTGPDDNTPVDPTIHELLPFMMHIPGDDNG